jgi:hypothetical protein
MPLTDEVDLHDTGQSPTILVPRTEEDRVAVRKQLKQILASSPFGTSKRYPALLRYVVEEALQGHSDRLKERCLGIEVFHRDPAYDTNTDPVVRFTAGEVRKRLAQYYYDSKHAQEIHIELPHGSYVPEFRIPHADEIEKTPPSISPSDQFLTPEPNGHDLHPISELITLKPDRIKKIYALLIFSLLAGLALGAATVRLHPWTRANALDRFWTPFFASSNPVLLSVGQQFAGQLEMKPNAARNRLGQFYSGKIDFEPDGAPARTDVLAKMSSKSATPREVPVFALANMVTLASVVSVLQNKNKAYSIHGQSDTTFSDLSSSPSVLIGAYDNDWTIRLTDQLRFHFERDPDTGRPWIADRQKPSEKIGLKDKGLPRSEDYAIISRVYDPTTEQMVITLAGIGSHGTLAAGEFISSPAYIEEFAKQAPRNWDQGNVQLVIKVDIVDGKDGPPHVIANYFW